MNTFDRDYPVLFTESTWIWLFLSVEVLQAYFVQVTLEVQPFLSYYESGMEKNVTQDN